MAISSVSTADMLNGPKRMIFGSALRSHAPELGEPLPLLQGPSRVLLGPLCDVGLLLLSRLVLGLVHGPGVGDEALGVPVVDVAEGCTELRRQGTRFYSSSLFREARLEEGRKGMQNDMGDRMVLENCSKLAHLWAWCPCERPPGKPPEAPPPRSPSQSHPPAPP